MKRTILLALLAGMPAFALGQPSAPGPFCTIVAPAGAPPLVQQAAAELRSYLERLTGRRVPVSGMAPRSTPAIILRVDATAQALGEEGYSVQPVPARPGSAPSVTIRGRTPLGVLHGAYRLLREYGIGFYFDGDAVPTQPPARFLLPRVQAKPVFAIRGSLPWYNFFDSPTTWDDHDFRFFADQIVRSGQNFIGFHTYDNEPFAAYQDGGRIVGGEPLLTTADRVWGTFPLPVDEFGFGTGRFFLGRFWGSDAARQPGSRQERIARQKALLARGLAYASARGIKTCLGFEVSGDPSDPAEQRRFRLRLQQLVTDYPMLDYVWLWQPEAMSLEGTEPPPLRSQGAMLYREWEPAFAYIRKPARRWEGMRVAAYARLARQLLDGIAPDVRLVLSGWGGDHHLHVSDYFPAWDRVLDKRIIFAALDDIVVGPAVSQYYRLPADRERWAIPWYEYDGDQWFPQANAHVFAETVRDARRKGCQGLLAIHWRMKEVAESQALVARYAWEPQQTLAGFYRDYGIRRFGPREGAAIGKILQELDAMGYRWLGGPGQAECAPFSWCYVPDADRGRKLRAVRARLLALRPRLLADHPPSEALGRLDDVVATIDRGLLFNQVARLMVAGGPVDRALAMDPADPKRAETCRRLLRELTGPAFGDMLHRWAQTITTRGELGVLATINAKAYYDLRQKVARLRDACGESSDTADLTRPSPRHCGLVSDFQQTTLAVGMPLTVRCVAFAGAHPARRVTLLYTTSQPAGKGAAAGLASVRWVGVPMRRLERCVFEATLPPQALPARGGWVRYRIVAQLPNGSLEWPAIRGAPYRQVHLFPSLTLVSRHNRVRATASELAGDQKLRARVTGTGTVRLSWEPSAPLATALLERRAPGSSWERLGATLDREWEDASAPHSSRVEYRLLSGSGVPLSECAVVTPPAAQPSTPTGLTARARGTAVRLTWDGGDLSVSHFTVERATSPEGPFVAITPEAGIAPRGFATCTYVDRPRQDGTLFYRVLAHGFGTTPPAVSEAVAARTSASVPRPRLDLDFEDNRVTAPTGPVTFSGPHRLERVDGRCVLHTDGGLLVPYGPAVAVRPPFTVAVRFRQTETTPMPVLVGQGAWMGPGYFVQLLNGQLRFYVGGAGCLDRRVDVQPGRWHTAVCVHDGAVLSSYFDGIFLGEQPVEGEMRPSDLPFTVARYCQVGPEWSFKGDVDFVRLYDAALEPWMVLHSSNGSAAGVDLDWGSTDVALAGQKATWHQTPRVLDTPEGAAADLSGGLTIPFGDLLPQGDSLVLETRFLARSLDGMPVLLSQGVWPGEGYLLQILGRRIRFHIGGIGSLDCGPELEANRWYRVRCVYDGSAMRVWLDGQPVGQRATADPMLPSLRPLRVGRYEMDGSEYVFHGLLGRTRIHAGPLDPPSS